jgi:hypothetical protein
MCVCVWLTTHFEPICNISLLENADGAEINKIFELMCSGLVLQDGRRAMIAHIVRCDKQNLKIETSVNQIITIVFFRYTQSTFDRLAPISQNVFVQSCESTRTTQPLQSCRRPQQIDARHPTHLSWQSVFHLLLKDVFSVSSITCCWCCFLTYLPPPISIPSKDFSAVSKHKSMRQSMQ